MIRKLLLKLSKSLVKDLERLEKLEEVYGRFLDLKLSIDKYLDNKDYLDDLTEAQRKEFVQLVSAVHENKAFKVVYKKFLNIQGCSAILERSEASDFHKGGINALWMLDQEIGKFHSEHKSNITPEEDYDPHKVI